MALKTEQHFDIWKGDASSEWKKRAGTDAQGPCGDWCGLRNVTRRLEGDPAREASWSHFVES